MFLCICSTFLYIYILLFARVHAVCYIEFSIQGRRVKPSTLVSCFTHAYHLVVLVIWLGKLCMCVNLSGRMRDLDVIYSSIGFFFVCQQRNFARPDITTPFRCLYGKIHFRFETLSWLNKYISFVNRAFDMYHITYIYW